MRFKENWVGEILRPVDLSQKMMDRKDLFVESESATIESVE
jgi:hypothetical protein